MGRSRLTSFRFDLAEAPKARLGVSFIVLSPPDSGSIGRPLHPYLTPLSKTTGDRTVTGMSAGRMPSVRWFTPTGYRAARNNPHQYIAGPQLKSAAYYVHSRTILVYTSFQRTNASTA